MSATFATWKDRALWAILAAAPVLALSWACWVTLELQATRYDHDRPLIMSELAREENEKLATVVQKNTEAINLLRIELAKLGGD